MIDVSAIGGSSCAHDAKANSIFCSPALSLMLQLSSELQHRVVCCPGFLHTATLSYIRLLQIYLDGLELKAASQLSKNQVTENSRRQLILHPGHLADAMFELQVESFQILSLAKRFLLRAISQRPATSLSSRQLTQVTYRHTVFIRPVEKCQSRLCPFSLSAGRSSSSLNVKTQTQRWRQLFPCTLTPTASAQRWTSCDRLRTDCYPANFIAVLII